MQTIDLKTFDLNTIDYRIKMLICLCGLIVFIASFFAYVFIPKGIFVATFIIGFIMIVAGYTMLFLTYRVIKNEIVEEMRSGLFICLDDYDLSNDATIETLEVA